jgi:hypothetical protein
MLEVALHNNLKLLLKNLTPQTRSKSSLTFLDAIGMTEVQDINIIVFQEQHQSAVTLSVIAMVIAIVEALYIFSREAVLWLRCHGQDQNGGRHQLEIEMEDNTSSEHSERALRPKFRFVVQPPSSPTSPTEPHLHRAQVHF